MGEETVTLVVPAVIVRQLDHHKDSHSLSKIQERARGALQRIESLVLNKDDAVELPPGVDFRFVEEPTIKFDDYSLHESVDDDSLLASCIELKEEYPSAQVVLVSHDTTPRLKARKRNVETVELPDQYRLPSAQGELEKEKRRLQRKVQKLENRLPDLDLRFQGGSKHSSHTVEPPSLLSEEEIDERISELKEEYPRKDPPATDPSSGDPETVAQMVQMLREHVRPPESEFERYNDDREEFFEDYADYLGATNQFRRKKSRTVRLEIELVNQGSAPAEDIDILMHFPDGVEVLGKDDLPSRPEEPTPPQSPRSVPEITPSLTSPPVPNPHIHTPPSTTSPNVSSPDIEETGSYRVTFHVRRLKQNNTASCDPLFVVYESIAGAFSFSIDYTINTASLPEEDTGQLSVVIED